MLRVFDKKIRQSTLQVVCFSGIIAGIGFSRNFGPIAIKTFILIAFCLFLTIYKRNISLGLALFAAFLLIGVLRGQGYEKTLIPIGSNYYRTVTLKGRVLNDAVYGTKKQLSFDLGSIYISNGGSVPGKIKVAGFGENTILSGNTVFVTGKLMPGYGQYEARMSFAKIQLIERNSSVLDEFRRRFVAGMETALPEPQASFAMGILVGHRSNLPESLKNAFLMVGLTHIIAVSGYNLTIIINALQKLSTGSSRRLLALLIAILATFFVILAGASASIVRAYLVSMLSLLAGYYGRRFRPLNLILIVAALTAFVNPRNIWSDISWYLSFLAFYGVLVVAPLLIATFGKRLGESVVLSAVIESISAEIMCLPLLLLIFGQMSLIGLLANALVVPLVPLAMLFSFIAGSAGMINLWLVGFVAIPAKLILSFILSLVQNLSGIPKIFASNLYINNWTAVFCYLVIFATSITISYRFRHAKYVIITDKNERSQQMVDNQT